MKLYHFDPETGVCVGYSDATLDPGERDLAIRKAMEAAPDAKSLTVSFDKWIVPAHATPLEPPKYDAAKEDLIFRDRWFIVPKGKTP